MFECIGILLSIVMATKGNVPDPQKGSHIFNYVLELSDFLY